VIRSARVFAAEETEWLGQAAVTTFLSVRKCAIEKQADAVGGPG